MKYQLQTLVIALFLPVFSCLKSSSPSRLTTGLAGEWRVTELVTAPQIAGATPETKTENNLGFIQTLVLKNDGTYVKTRVTGTNTVTISGEYTDKIVEGTHNVSLQYNTTDHGVLHESCFATGEGLALKDGFLLNNFWPACDGPYTLKYRKVK